jgi:hypothetical protein
MSNSKKEQRYFEWWYLHFVCDSGRAFSLLIHPTDIFGTNDDHYMTISMINPQHNSVQYFRQSLPNGIFEKKVDLPECDNEYISINITDNKIEMRLLFSDLSLNINLHDFYPKIFRDKPILYLSPTGEEAHNWVHVIPFGSFEVFGAHDGTEIIDKGFFYQDHNWGTAPIQENMRHWLNGQVVFDNGFIIFSHMELNTGVISNRWYSDIENKVSISEHFDVNGGLDGRKKSHLSISNKDSGLFLKVHEINVFRNRIEYLNESKMHYLRGQCEAMLLTNTDENIAATGVLENFHFLHKR